MGELLSPHTEHIRQELVVLDDIRDELKRSVREPYLSYSPEVRQLYVGRAMLSLTEDWDFTNSVLAKQGGSETWKLSFEEAEGMPERALMRLKQSFDRRSACLWPWLARKKEPEKVEEYLRVYKAAAKKSGLYPRLPSLETVPLQRNIDWRHRVLAAHFMFIENCAETPDIEYAGAPFLLMINTARKRYMNYPQEELQRAVLAKAKNLTEVQVAQLTEDGLWQDSEALSYMCVDRGLRDLVIDLYGLMRGISIKISGYSDGQEFMHNRTVLQQCLRVAA